MDSAALEAAGWRPLAVDGYSGTVGPVWTRGRKGETEVGMIVEPRHSNVHIGTLHGGALATFADIALGLHVVQLLGEPRCATLQLQMQYISTAKIGEFVRCKPEVLRAGKQLIFVRGVISADDRAIAHADAIWKIFEARAKPG